MNKPYFFTQMFFFTACIVMHSSLSAKFHYDATVVGFVDKSDGLGQVGHVFLDCLHKQLKVNHINISKTLFPMSLSRIAPGLHSIIKNPDKSGGKVAILTSGITEYTAMPQDSPIKIAYSMFEATKLPASWVEILNKHFDAVAVPNEWNYHVYKSALKIPVFKVGLGLYLDRFLKLPQGKKRLKPFVFGNTAAVFVHKNPLLLIEAFHKAFGNSSDVKLVINGRVGDSNISEQVRKKIAALNATNISFNVKHLSDKEYVAFMRKLHCLVNPSLGEGFSISPYEALSMGIPVIVSNNSAQKVLAATGFVKSVPSNILVPANYPTLGNCGYFSACTVDDLAKAMQDVYLNYPTYVKKALEGKKWVHHFMYHHFCKIYANLIRPKILRRGKKNEITQDTLTTNSESLYLKYSAVLREPLMRPKKATRKRR